MTTEIHMNALRERSGSVDSSDPLVSLLYILIRDHLPLGVVEEVMMRHCGPGDSRFTNGWLATYCKDLAKRLR